MTLAAAFIRVSTGSQDEASQVKAIDAYAKAHDIALVKTFTLKGYSASKGTQEPALRAAIADIQNREYTTLIVTESSRLDRRDDLDAQAEILLAIRAAGGDIISISEPNFGKTDFAGRIITLAIQNANAQKSIEVKNTTYRGMKLVRDNNAHHGSLPSFWATKGKRYAKQAYCVDPAAVSDMYERVADGESLASVGRSYDLWPTSVRTLIRFAANHTGIIECSYTHFGERETWTHEVAPVVESSLWWAANRVVDANLTSDRVNKGGRPVATPENWMSGVLECPGCNGKLYMKAGSTPAGNPRIPKLRCGGYSKQRLTCGRFKGCDAQPIVDLVCQMFASDTTEILAFQRVTGNAHELDALRASLSKLQARLSATEDDDELDAMIASRKAIKAQIESFTVVADSYDYAPTGLTVSQMWMDGDDTVKRALVRAVKSAWGLSLVLQDGIWALAINADRAEIASDESIVDLGNGLCFRR